MKKPVTPSHFLRASLLAPALLIPAIAAAQTSSLTVNLIAQRMTAVTPDGASTPMWGYCQSTSAVDASGNPVTTVTTGGGAPCVADPGASAPNPTPWSPGPTLVVPAGSALTINLTNNLQASTSIRIVGQIGTSASGNAVPRVPSPLHAGQPAITWPTHNPAASFTPAVQPDRARAFVPEAAAWSGAAGGTQSYSWSNLQPGTYLYEAASVPSLQVPMGLYGVLIVTKAPSASTAGGTIDTAGQAYPNVSYDADATVLFSEIDPRQNAAVDAAAAARHDDVLTLFNDTSCATAACYPPAVNYAPTYFLVNGRAFDPTNPALSSIPTSGNAKVSGQVLLRLLNAGLRTHVPSLVGVPDSVQLVAEDAHPLPGNARLQSQVLLTAGKVMDVVIKPNWTASTTGSTAVGTYDAVAFPIFDRALSLTSSNLDHQTAVANSGMIGYIAVQDGGAATVTPAVPAALQGKARDDIFAAALGSIFNGNVLSNDVNAVTAALAGRPSLQGTLIFNPDGSFAYTAKGTSSYTDSFRYCINGSTSLCATVTLNVGSSSGPPQPADYTFTSSVASVFKSSAPGLLANSTDPASLPMTATLVPGSDCRDVRVSADGSFIAAPTAKAPSCTFQYSLTNSQGVQSTANGTVTLNFPAGSGLVVNLKDTQDGSKPTDDYSWVIEQDLTFFHDPSNPATGDTLATNFHRSYMPVIATGCTGPISCGDANTSSDPNYKPRLHSFPADVVLDRSQRYFISVLPGDADAGSASYDAQGNLVDYDANGNVIPPTFGHSMGGASFSGAQAAVDVLVPRNPLPPAQLSVIVFEDNNPTNGGVDDGEQGLGGFTINFYDTRGSSGDPAGLMTYDMSAMPLTNSLANTIDSATKANLCPMNAPSGTIITCPELDSRGQPSPLAGMALVKNINPGRYDVWATPGGVHAGENWIQVSTLEGTPANDTFVKPGEPPYWQEFGPPGFHSFIGFVNPDHVAKVNASLRGTADIVGRIPSLHMDRPRPTYAVLNDSCASANNGTGDTSKDPQTCRATLAQTTCYVAVNSTGGTGANVGMAACDAEGKFKIMGIPAGTHSLVIWDQWLDQIIAYKAVTVPSGGTAANHLQVQAGDVPVFSWFTRVQEEAFQDLNGNGIRDEGEPGLAQVPMNIRFRDGSISTFLATDGNGSAAANELFPLFNWYVLESDNTRYAGTGVLTVYDAGGKPDTAPLAVTPLTTGAPPVLKHFEGLLNSSEPYPLDAAHQIPTSVYTPGKTARIDPGTTLTEGTQGYINQTAVVEWGKRPYVAGENGGISGMVYYASTRGFDDPTLEVQFSWEPGVPNVPLNLYQEVKDPATGAVKRVLVDRTTTWSWDAGVSGMNCPGDTNATDAVTGKPLDPFVTVTLNGNATKCYDGQHSFNQIQPQVYDGRYRFPTAACTVCVPNPADSSLPKILPPGKYVVELVTPPGYEIVKEEDKNILIGDPYIGPYAATQFMGVGNIFIVPDQATLNDATRPGFGQAFPRCVGALHRVPNYLTLFPDSGQIAPYAGQDRPLCDHKEVTLGDQTLAAADFQIFTQTPIAGHISGIMLNDAASEFDPVNPAFLEKASLPNAPVSIRDYNGVEIGRVYNDKWGTFNMLVPSTWDANVPNPSGYAPNMLTFCMNDPGPLKDAITGRSKRDPMYNPQFSDFCYVWPSMPGITTYLDTPVLPLSAYASASRYEPVDCAYPDATPAIYRVDGDGRFGPFIDKGNAAAPHVLTIKALGDTAVNNPLYAGPLAQASGTGAIQPNAPTITRHYGFGNQAGTVTIGGSSAGISVQNWTDDTITVKVDPTRAATGQLVVTNAQGVASIDAVTITIDASKPIYVSPAPDSSSLQNSLAHPIQDAIDAAQPGDLILIDAGYYPELVVMDRPVRLQGVGAAAVIIEATKYPNQKVDAWRARINGLFGLDAQGNNLPNVSVTPVDPLPGQEITGGVVRLEPSVLATEEGPGITVLAKGYKADGSTLLTGQDCGSTGGNSNPAVIHKHNFLCGPSRIDGVSVTGSDAGGGIYVNGWAHNLEISNNRVYGNAGALNGGVRIGQPYLEGQAIPNSSFRGFGYDRGVNIHNNAISTNGTIEGNAVAGALAAQAGGAGGGLSICAGSDNYKVTNNWICGNFSSSDGGGIGHLGLSMNGTIRGNKILFNESYNQTGPQYGGGLAIEGEGATATALSLGTGSVTVDSNIILGNFARAGSGGGVRLAYVNGAERARGLQWKITLQNNMIVNNLAGWAGAGVSLSDSLYTTLVNNTIASNDSVGIAGSLFSTQVGAANTQAVTTVPSPAGIASELTSVQLLASLPQGQRAANRASVPVLLNDILWHNRSFFFSMKSGTAQLYASNDWQDAVAPSLPPAFSSLSFDASQCAISGEKYWDLGVVGDTAAVSSNVSAQIASVSGAVRNNGTTITLTTSQTINLPANSPTSVQIGGVTSRGTPDIAAAVNGTRTVTIIGPRTLRMSVTSTSASFNNTVFAGATVQYQPPANPVLNAGNSVLSTSPEGGQLFKKLYCNGSIVQPGMKFEPSTPFQPPATLQPAATLDESGNFVDLHFGPLSLKDEATGLSDNGDYHLFSGTGASPLALNTGAASGPGGAVAPSYDFEGDVRPQGGGYEIGADEVAVPAPRASVSPATLDFGSVTVGQSSAPQALSVSNTGTLPLSITSVAASNAAFVVTNGCPVAPATLAAGGNCTISVVFTPAGAGRASGTLTITDDSGAVAGSTQTVSLSGLGTVPPLSLTPASYDFGNVARGLAAATAPTAVFTLTNNTANPVSLQRALQQTPSNSGFSIVGTGTTCPTAGNLVGNGSCQVTLRANPGNAVLPKTTLRATLGFGSRFGVVTSTVTAVAQ